MTRFTKTVAILVLALWGLAREHCALEQVPGFQFLACCQHTDTAPHQDNDCDEDGCAVVETGYYQPEDNPPPTPGLEVTLASLTLERVPAAAADSGLGVLGVSSAPPELPRMWQFHTRAARPPRAPSFPA